jgi:hypothetical protein
MPRWLFVSFLFLVTFCRTSTAKIGDDDNDNGDDARHGCCFRDDHPDRMAFFPGWNQPLPSKWFSGYLEYELEGRKVHTHYVLVQAEEQQQEDDKELPLIYW